MVTISRKEKLIKKMKNNPKSIRFEELDKILNDVGFSCRQPKGGSSHYTYVLEDKLLTIPYNRPFIKVIYIKIAIRILEELGY